MATIKIIGWRDNNIGYTGWDNHANAELKRRLARSINISSREVKVKRSMVINGVKESEVESLTQILHTMGAELDISLDK